MKSNLNNLFQKKDTVTASDKASELFAREKAKSIFEVIDKLSSIETNNDYFIKKSTIYIPRLKSLIPELDRLHSEIRKDFISNVTTKVSKNLGNPKTLAKMQKYRTTLLPYRKLIDRFEKEFEKSLADNPIVTAEGFEKTNFKDHYDILEYLIQTRDDLKKAQRDFSSTKSQLLNEMLINSDEFGKKEFFILLKNDFETYPEDFKRYAKKYDLNNNEDFLFELKHLKEVLGYPKSVFTRDFLTNEEKSTNEVLEKTMNKLNALNAKKATLTNEKKPLSESFKKTIDAVKNEFNAQTSKTSLLKSINKLISKEIHYTNNVRYQMYC